MMLSPIQRRALRFMRDHPMFSAEWRRGLEAAYGAAWFWDAVMLEDGEVSVTIPLSDWRKLGPAFEASPRKGRLFELTTRGFTLLARSVS